jgi:hypothetical protein
VCKARFHREAEARASIDYMNAQKGGFGVYFVNRPEIDHKYEHHRELMAELAHNNPEFLELLERQYELRLEFEAKGGIVRSAIGSSE